MHVYRDIGFFCAIVVSWVGVPILDECAAFCSDIALLVAPGITLADLPETAWWYSGVELVLLGKGLVAAGDAGKSPFICVILELSSIASLISDAVELVLAGIPDILQDLELNKYSYLSVIAGFLNYKSFHYKYCLYTRTPSITVT